MKKTISYLRVLVIMLFCLVTLSVGAKEWQREWYIAVKKAELHRNPDINSPIVGYVYKGEKPLSAGMNKDGSWVLMKTDNTNAEGWVMTCACETSKDSYSYNHFDYETCYEINKALAKGEISQEEFAEMLYKLQNYYSVDEDIEEFCDIEEGDHIYYAQERPWIPLKYLAIATIALWFVCLISFVLFLAPSTPILKHTGIYILLLGACEILFVLHPEAPTNLRTGRMIEILVLVVGQLLIMALIGASARNTFEKISMRIGALMLLAAIGIFIYNFGVGNFVLSVVEAIIGIILLIIVGAIVVMVIKAPPSKPRKKEDKKENPYETCYYCRYFDYSEMECLYWKGHRSSGDTCDKFTP